MANDKYFFTGDNVRIHWRDYPGSAGRPAVLCLPGLTRNMRDFTDLAERLAPRYRTIIVSFRGRGESGYARDPLSYVPLTYVSDLGRLIREAALHRFVIIGTSLGGLVGMLLDMTHQRQIAGLVLNDVSPDPEAAGLERVRQQVGRGGNWLTWLHAARALEADQAAIYPGWQLRDWLAHAKRLCRITREGRIDWDYDPAIAMPLAMPHNDDSIDFRNALMGYANRPVLSIRGGRSDILSRTGQLRMELLLPGLRTVEVPRVGHAPTLMEPVAIDAIETMLACL